MMGPNTAPTSRWADQIGTLEPGSSPTLFFWTAIRGKAIGLAEDQSWWLREAWLWVDKR